MNTKKENITNNIIPQNKTTDILKQYFGHCFDKSGDFNIEKFQEEISNKEVSFSKESYGLNWLGKSYSRLLASDKTETLLKEDKNFNQKKENINSNNLLIKGDNLEVLKHLSNAYYEQIKMIYIDPPYNTGSDGFVYQDNKKITIKELQQLAGIEEQKAKQILEFTKSKSNSHSAWLTFMYPRLYIAKHLLSDDGVIFISIDDNEVAQLRLLLDDIFGEENFIGEIIWNSKYTTSNDAKYLSNQHETILFYSKVKSSFEIGLLDRTEEQNKSYKNRDDDPKGRWKATPIHAKSGTEDNVYTITFPNGVSWKAPDGRYPRYSKTKLLELYINNELYFNSKGNVDKKTYLSEVKQGVTAGTVWKYDIVGHTHGNNEELADLIGKGKFDNPKGTKLIKHLAKIANLKPNSIVLDFFGGSGTTADAVLQINAENKESFIQFILVQLPELIDKNKNKVAYQFVTDELEVKHPTIFEITKERIIRAAKKIQDDNTNSDNLLKKDLGFKVFEVGPIWENYLLNSNELSTETNLFNEHQLNDNDLKSLFITWKTYDGILLSEEPIEYNIGGYRAFYVKNKLYLMDKGFRTNNLKALLEKIDSDKEFNPISIIVFGYNFESKSLLEIAENIKSYTNKKNIDIDFLTRY